MHKIPSPLAYSRALLLQLVFLPSPLHHPFFPLYWSIHISIQILFYIFLFYKQNKANKNKPKQQESHCPISLLDRIGKFFSCYLKFLFPTSSSNQISSCTTPELLLPKLPMIPKKLNLVALSQFSSYLIVTGNYFLLLKILFPMASKMPHQLTFPLSFWKPLTAFFTFFSLTYFLNVRWPRI